MFHKKIQVRSVTSTFNDLYSWIYSSLYIGYQFIILNFIFGTFVGFLSSIWIIPKHHLKYIKYHNHFLNKAKNITYILRYDRFYYETWNTFPILQKPIDTSTISTQLPNGLYICFRILYNFVITHFHDLGSNIYQVIYVRK